MAMFEIGWKKVPDIRCRGDRRRGVVRWRGEREREREREEGSKWSVGIRAVAVVVRVWDCG